MSFSHVPEGDHG
ncbi:unnamed protein product, partial [Rotaria sp. Silwood2]